MQWDLQFRSAMYQWVINNHILNTFSQILLDGLKQVIYFRIRMCSIINRKVMY